MCGEHFGYGVFAGIVEGSSPHVRGAPHFLLVVVGLPGIIPACAGSTICENSPQVKPRDHPRMCGEHFFLHGDLQCCEGSSPHVRGAPSSALTTSSSCGIIPACAGSTKLDIAMRFVGRDHPRMCGEHAAPAAVPVRTPGSSPHVRGARWCAGHPHHRQGIIPACAGSTPVFRWLF